MWYRIEHFVDILHNFAFFLLNFFSNLIFCLDFKVSKTLSDSDPEPPGQDGRVVEEAVEGVQDNLPFHVLQLSSQV